MKLKRSKLLRDGFSFLLLAALLASGAPAGAWPDAKPAFPIVPDATGRGLVDQNGVPFLVVGDSPWGMMLKLDDQDLATYFADRRARGFNSLLVRSAESGAFGGPANTNGDPPFSPAGDFASPVEAYWSRVDAIVDAAAAEGFLIFLTPMYLGFECGGEGLAAEMQQNSLANHTSFANFLGGRYAGRDNLIWVHGGDVDAATCNPSLDAKVDEIANRLVVTTPEKIHTAHCGREDQALDCYDENWLSMNSVYSSCPLASLEIRRAYQNPAVLPHFFIEGRYENEAGWSTQCLKSQLYWASLGGIQGSIYGNNPIWFFGAGWQSALADPGANLVERYARLIKSRNWADLVPDYSHQVVTSGFGVIGTPNYVGAAITSDNRTLVAYAPVTTTLTVDMSRLATSDVIEGWSYNTTTGLNTSLGTFANNGAQNFSMSAGSVLVLDDRALGLGPPGVGIFYVPEPTSVPALTGLFTALYGLARRRPRLVRKVSSGSRAACRVGGALFRVSSLHG